MTNTVFRHACSVWSTVLFFASAFLAPDRLPAQVPEPDPAGRGIITGTVLDRETRAPLPGATIEVLETTRGTIADESGRFRIASLQAGIYRLRVTSIGYEPAVVSDVVVNASRPQDVLVELNEAELETGDVIVRPDYFGESNDRVTSAKTLSNEEIRRLPGGFEDVVRAVSILPGVAQVQNGRNDLLVRGGAPSENLFLIDGIESPNINHFGTQGAGGGPLSFVNLDFVRETTFSTGGFGARYGDKISSVLTLDLRAGREDRFGGKATVSASQFGLNLEGPITEQGSWIFSARRSYLDFIFRAAGFSFVPEYWDFFGKFDYRLGPNDRISGLAIGAIDRVRFFNDDADDRFENSQVLNNSQDQLVAGLTWSHLFENGYVNTTLGRTRIDYRFSQTDSSLQPIFVNNSIEDEFNLGMNGLTRLGETELAFGGNVKTTAFVSSIVLRQPGVDVDVDPNDRFYKGALFAQLSHDLLGISITPGVRLDWFDGIEETLYPSYRIGISAPIVPALSLKASGGIYYQAPSYVWLAAEPENRKLRAIRANVGVVGAEVYPEEDWKVSLEGYVKLYEDYPASLSRTYLVLANTGAGFGGAEEGFASFGLEPLASMGQGNAYGGELFVQKKLSSTPWYGVASLSLNRSLFTAIDGVERPSNYDQSVIFNVSGGWRISEGWEIAAKFRFASGRPFTPVDSTGDPTFGYKVVEQYNERRLAPSHALDLRIDRRWPFNGWTLITYADIQNVYNRVNPNPPRWNARTRTGEIDDAIGILPSIGISAEW